jgi:MFS superfamily sulfate permease-like transporter
LPIPGFRLARTYRREWFPSDVVAGVSLAAVALPIGIAYARLAGFPPVVGIYSCILPPVAYALFGSSRQLIVNPDAAACAIVASTLAPMAAGDAAHYADLSGYLNGIALSIIAGQLGTLLGFTVASAGFFGTLAQRRAFPRRIFLRSAPASCGLLSSGRAASSWSASAA